MDTILQVRFIGAYLLVLDEKASPPKAMIYLRKSPCNDDGPHLPMVTFDAEAEFATSEEDRLIVDLAGNKLVRRPLPMDGDILGFRLPTDEKDLRIERQREPSQVSDADLRISLLPSLKCGGAGKILPPEQLRELSYVALDLGGIGYISCERVFRLPSGVPGLWKFVTTNKEPNKKHRQPLADILTWTVQLKRPSATIFSISKKGTTSDILSLQRAAPKPINLFISNLGSKPAAVRYDKLDDFKYLLEYSDLAPRDFRIPKLVKIPVTGGGAMCPGSRWP